MRIYGLKNEVNEILQFLIPNTQSVETSSIFKSISVSLDKTPQQIEYLKKWKAEKDKRLNSGESNIKL